MTNAELTKRAAYDVAKYAAAKAINDALDAALDTFELDGDEQDQFRSDVIELVTDEV